MRSLSGLIDFDCAARWGSFKLAAQELHKTPAAISQQVRHLEENLGFALFIRHPRHVTLTEKAEQIVATFEAWQAISAGIEGKRMAAKKAVASAETAEAIASAAAVEWQGQGDGPA